MSLSQIARIRIPKEILKCIDKYGNIFADMNVQRPLILVWTLALTNVCNDLIYNILRHLILEDFKRIKIIPLNTIVEFPMNYPFAPPKLIYRYKIDKVQGPLWDSLHEAHCGILADCWSPSTSLLYILELLYSFMRIATI